MHEQPSGQEPLVNLYRAATITPSSVLLPGMEPGDIVVEVTAEADLLSPRFLGHAAEDNHAATSAANACRTATGERSHAGR